MTYLEILATVFVSFYLLHGIFLVVRDIILIKQKHLDNIYQNERKVLIDNASNYRERMEYFKGELIKEKNKLLVRTELDSQF